MAEENIARAIFDKEKDWLSKELRSAENSIRQWPEWMRRTGKIGKLPPMKKLIFGKGLLVPTLRGEKKISIRKFRKEAHDLIDDELFIGSFQDGLDIILIAIRDTETKPFSKITDKEAKEGGYKHAKNALWRLKKDFYPDLKSEDIAAIIRYEVLQIDNTPVVSANGFIQNKTKV